MTSQQKQETLVPIFLSQEEYNHIMSQPPHLQQQIYQEIYQKQQQQVFLQPQQQQQQQQHPYLQMQQQQLNQTQNSNAQIAIPQIPTHPNQNPLVYFQGQPQYAYNIQQQQFILNQNQNLNQNLLREQQKPLKHTSITQAGNLELKYFSEWTTYLFMLEISISLFVNTLSSLFRLELVTYDYSYCSGLWAVLILFVILNLFILTNPAYITNNNNQKLFYYAHVILYVLLMQGLQTAVSGSARIFSWDTNYFYSFYLIIGVQFISVRFAIKRFGVRQPIKKYQYFIIFPPIIVYFLDFICQYYRYFYIPLFLWVFVVMLVGYGNIYLINKIVEKGYNKFQTNHVYAMAASIPILMICPFYDEE